MPPRSALVRGVPFVGWGEAPTLERSGVRANPSIPACLLMIFKYWSDEPGRSAPPKEELEYPLDFPQWQTINENAKGIDEIKQPLAEGTPVYVKTGLTPIGHSWGLPMLPVSGPFPAHNLGPRSDMLGVIAPYEMFRLVMPQLLNEVVTAADRVVVGYDDDRRIITVHDPSFGPGWEMPYDMFDAMWEPMGRSFTVLRPEDTAERLARREQAVAYRSATTNERAARHYVSGYALACVQARKEARQRLQEGLELPDISSGYRHLFLVELAVQAMSDGDSSSAIRLLREATGLIPHHSLPWRMLLAIYESNPSLLRPWEVLKARYRYWISCRHWARDITRNALPSDCLLYVGGMGYLPYDPPPTTAPEQHDQ